MEEIYNEGRPLGADKFERVAFPMKYRESQDNYDVIVVGGGIAGCAAALAASRHGSRVLLIEKMTMLGGLATAGNIVLYLPLCDGYGNQVIYGIAEEFFRDSIKYSYSFPDWDKWKEKGVRYETVFNGPAFALTLEEKLQEEGVEILYDSLFVGAERNGDKIEGIYIENKGGRTRLKASVYIDASGDADIFARLGEECMARENSLAIWAYAVEGGEKHTMKRASSPDLKLRMVTLGTVDKSAARMETTTPYFGDTGEGVNRFIQDGHRRLLSELKKDPTLTLANLPSMPEIRMTRRIVGEETFNGDAMGKKAKGSVGCTGDWRKPSGVIEIPFHALHGRLSNVLAAGRCISAEGEAWEITRVIPPAALTGQAAGTAAAMMAKDHISASRLDVEKLRDNLRKDGVKLDWN